MKDLIKEVPKELFDIGNPGEKREYLFVGLEGKKETVFLDFEINYLIKDAFRWHISCYLYRFP